MRRHLERRLEALPRYRQRLSRRTTGGLRWPEWEPDDGFDIAAHVTRAALPRPGGERELLAWAADFWSHRLDRARPLWRAVLLEGLAGGPLGARDQDPPLPRGRRRLDRRGHGAARRRAEARPPWKAADPDASRAAAGSANSCVAWPAMPSRRRRRPRGRFAIRDAPPRRSTPRAQCSSCSIRDELVAAPRTSINVQLSEHRRLAVTEVPLEEIKAIKRALGGTVNDVILSLVTAGLRELLVERGESRPPRACARWCRSTSVQRPSTSSSGTASPRCSSISGRGGEPSARYRRVRAQTMKLKASHQAAGGKLLVDLAGLAPPGAAQRASPESLFATRLFNVTVTNVPGSQTTLYAFGSPLRRVIPLVPLAAEHAVAVAALSYDGTVFFCVHADRDAAPDAHRVVEGIQAELDALGLVAERAAAVAAREAALARQPAHG